MHLWRRRPGFDPLAGKILWRREEQPTPVFLPRVFYGQRSLGAIVPGVTNSWTRLGDQPFKAFWWRSLFTCLLVTHTAAFVKWLLKTLPLFNVLFAISWLNLSSFSISWVQVLLSVFCVTNTFSQPTTHLSVSLKVSFNIFVFILLFPSASYLFSFAFGRLVKNIVIFHLVSFIAILIVCFCYVLLVVA